ncbi:MAG TPA: 2,3,4,5-tetrahydropyridine-2,6-dicarboxylate N-succinyltransferase, partial [Candidatus Kapabacteria bacterium]|nr:2,3,4,5-tetrahydropyridine-2,6-dicarboxylate N-succinyltransferase [Candidatus Kapabacteria bacterium]
MSELQTIIETAFDNRNNISPTSVDAKVKGAVLEALDLLDSGKARVAEKINGEWVVNQWLKKAVLLSFRIADNAVMDGG